MTRAEAWEILQHSWTKIINPDYTDEEVNEALNIAIDALEQEPRIKGNMDAVKFIKELTRYCNSTECEACKMDTENYICPASLDSEYADTLVGIIEKWSAEHPIKTNKQKFREIFGYVSLIDLNNPNYDSGWWDEEYIDPKE